MEYNFGSATILLLLITDPFGNIPVFAKALKHVPPERRAKVILRENLIAFGLLLVFMFMGESFLQLMGLRETSLQMAGGVLLFLIALRMIFPPPVPHEPELVGEPLIVPLAIPAIAGPSALATVILLFMQSRWKTNLMVTVNQKIYKKLPMPAKASGFSSPGLMTSPVQNTTATSQRTMAGRLF